MVGTVQCFLRSKEGTIGVGCYSQGGFHNEPVVKDVGFEELAGESIVNFSIKRIRVLEKTVLYWKEYGFWNQRDLDSNLDPFTYHQYDFKISKFSVYSLMNQD